VLHKSKAKQHAYTIADVLRISGKQDRRFQTSSQRASSAVTPTRRSRHCQADRQRVTQMN
jgi:hypothetical protein